MKWKAFGIVAAVALAIPFAALADNSPPGGGSSTTTTTSSPPKEAHAGAHWFAGAVTSAGSGSITVDVLMTGKHDTQLDGTSVSVAIDSSTEIHYGKGKSSIEAGDLVGVSATGTGASSLIARRINVTLQLPLRGGNARRDLDLEAPRPGRADRPLRRRIEGQQRHLRRRRRVSAEPQHRRQGGDRVLRHRVLQGSELQLAERDVHRAPPPRRPRQGRGGHQPVVS